LHGALGKEIFLKNKKPSLPTAFARGARHRIFSKHNRKTVFADDLFKGLSAQHFFKKKWKIVCADGRPRALGTDFLKNINKTLFADGPAERPSAKKISKNRLVNPR
jgi:hypothetical protein